MKTITEFFGMHLNNALKMSRELAVAGKNPEEVQAALGESLKVQGDKLKLLTTTLDVIKDRAEGLKRVVVLTLDEKEKVPANTEKRDEYYYLFEYFPGAANDRKKRRDGFRDRDGDSRGKRKGKRRGNGDKREFGKRPFGKRPFAAPRPVVGQSTVVIKPVTSRPATVQSEPAEQKPMSELALIRSQALASAQVSLPPATGEEGKNNRPPRRRRRFPKQRGPRPAITIEGQSVPTEGTDLKQAVEQLVSSEQPNPVQEPAETVLAQDQTNNNVTTS